MKLLAGTLLLFFTVLSLLIPAHAFTSQPVLLIADDTLTSKGGIAIVSLDSPTPAVWFSDPSGVISQHTDLVSNSTDIYFVFQGSGGLNPIGISQIDIATKTIIANLTLPPDPLLDPELSFLNGIDMDSSGNIYIAAAYPLDISGFGTGGAVYKYDSENNYVGAFFSSNFIVPIDVAVDDSDQVWVLDNEASEIFLIDQISNTITGLTTPPILVDPQKMIFIDSDTVAITDLDLLSFAPQILLVDLPSGTSSVLGPYPSLEFLSGIAFNSTSNLIYVVDQAPFVSKIPKVYSIDLLDSTTPNLIASGAPLSLPIGMILENIQIPEANLNLTKTGPEFIPTGKQFNYTITIRNDGPDPVSDVTIKDTHSLGILYVSSSPNVCSQKPSSVVECENIGTINSDESIDIVLTFAINTSNPPTTFPVTNTAVLSTGAIGNSVLDDKDSTNIEGIISGSYCGVDIKDYASIILGTSGNDVLVGTNNDDLIIGFAGDDVINGNDGNDCLIGDDTNNPSITGKDTINGGDGDDEIHGGPFDNILNGNDGDDKIFGGDRKDTINGGDGDDEIYGGDDDDILNGGDGDDKIFGGSNIDEINGGDGVDLCDEGTQPNTLDKVINCETDLIITLVGSPATVNVGAPLTYTSTIQNIGPSSATNVTLSVFLNNTVTISGPILSSGSATCTSVSSSGPVKCNIPLLKTTDPLQTITFTVIPGTAGIINASAKETTTLFIDHDPSNSSPEISTTVLPTVTNNPPIAVDDFYDVNANDILFIPAPGVLANDTDSDLDTLTAIIQTNANFGTVVLNPNGGFTFTASQIVFGSDTFTYVANDGTTNSSIATVTLTQKFCGKTIDQFGNNIIIGTPGNDKLKGTHGDDLIIGLGGNDKINGLKGDDCIIGGDGDDKINGNKGNDTIFGGNGNDKLNGNHGNDKIHGGDGNDDIKGNNGNDELFGDDGKDKIYGGNGDDFIDGGADKDKCKGGKGNNTIENCEDSKLEKDDKDDKDKKDKEDCDCEKPSIFTVGYSGPDDVAVEIYQKESYVGNADKILAVLDVEDGEITIHSEDDLDQNKLDSNTVYRVIDEDGSTIDIISIHTSCSQSLYQGQQFIGTNGVTLTVISGTDLDDDSTIPTDQCKVKNDDKNKPKDDKNKPKDDKNKPKDDKNKPKDDKNKK